MGLVIFLSSTLERRLDLPLHIKSSGKNRLQTHVFFIKFLARDSFVVNHEFEGLTVNEMIDPSCANWVHHVQYVLPQVCFNGYPL